ncbi:MAG TPA: polysaccharide deacetylase family protein [Gemmatimonadales bacterium]|nr:polysaccharide deacetylase family protein [Gemmatimonadales bacterium]
MTLTHVLSIDVEDWFQVENYAQAIPREQWPRCELRVADNVRRLLDLLGAADVRATFFVLGWLAARLPDLVRDIALAGHEIASHGWSHAPIWTLSERAFFDEVSRSRALLEDLSGQPVIGYRAPTFSVTRPTRWALQLLRRAGYRYDSSIFPVRHDRYGIPDAPTTLYREDGIWEVPLSVLEFRKLRLPVGGGGYFRLPAVADALGSAPPRAGRTAGRRLRPPLGVRPVPALGAWRRGGAHLPASSRDRSQRPQVRVALAGVPLRARAHRTGAARRGA